MRRWMLTWMIFILMCGQIQAQESCVIASGEPLRLGAVFPQNFLLIAQTSEAFAGVEAMRQAINACGGVQGRPVEWAFVPAQGRDQAIGAVATIMEADPVPLIIGSGFATVHQGLVESAEQWQIPIWEVTEQSFQLNEWIFSPQPNRYEIGAETAYYVRDHIVPTLSDQPRIALIHEELPRASEIARGFRSVLRSSLIVDVSYETRIPSPRELAIQLRESRVNIVFIVSFHWDIEQLWFNMRQADANVDAWMTVGDTDDISRACQHLGNTDGMLLVGTSGIVSDLFPVTLDPRIYQHYRDAYGSMPSDTANLSASGVYVLLHDILPTVSDLESAEAIQATLRDFRAGEMPNTAGTLTIQQSQAGNFCTIAPEILSTCAEPLQSFPTWRNRAIIQEERGC